MPLDLRTDSSLPAFSRGSLDDNPGDGSPESGAPQGQANAFLTWQPESIVDEPDRWGVVISVVDGAPQSKATVDVTPRRLQKFTLRPGDRVKWTNTGRGSGAQQGEAIADQWGLVTLPDVQVTRPGNRLLVVRN